MGSEMTMNSESSTLTVLKLHDDGSDWADYQPKIWNGLWRHIEGTASILVPYAVSNGIQMLANRKTPAMEDQIEAKESKIIDFEKREYLARHIILSTPSTWLGTKIKSLTTTKDMWNVVKQDATSKSTLYLLNAEDQLSSMKLANNDDSETHLMELKNHFQLMLQCRDNLMKIGSTMSDTRFNIIVMSSLPESYWPSIQMITVAEWANRPSGMQSNIMSADDLVAFIIEEAQHWVINNECTKNAESALAAHTKKPGKPKGKKKDKAQSDITCENCKKPGHAKPDCYSKGGGKEGQGPLQRRKGNAKEPDTAVVAADDDNNKLFTFTCTSDYAAVANGLDILKSKLGTCIDSGATHNYCPNHSKFSNYQSIECKITMADGWSLSTIGIGNLHVKLPNGSQKTKIMFKGAIHAPEMAFMLLSISRLDKAGYMVTFNRGMCTIKNPHSWTVATIPHSDGLYKIMAGKLVNPVKLANVTSDKMSITEMHKKLGHIAHSAVKHAIANNLITGIDLNLNSKPDFCEACAKAKSARQPFPKESDTRAEIFGERVHWNGTSISKKPKWKPLCGSPYRWCNQTNKALFLGQKKSDFQLVQKRWGLHWNAKWQSHQIMLFRQRKRVPVYPNG
jgi:gag-polypeptide of LTR copia-type/GAG-pre-integrase domain